MITYKIRVVRQWDDAAVVKTDALLQHNIAICKGMKIPAHSHVYTVYGVTRMQRHTKNLWATGSMKDPTVFTIQNKITGETRVGTMREHAEWMVENGWITETRNWGGTIIAADPETHCKGWKCITRASA